MTTIQIQEVGHVQEIRKSIAKVAGLSRYMSGQILTLSDEVQGLVIGFVDQEVSVLLLGPAETIKVGAKVYSRMESFTVPVGDRFLGRVVNALGEPIDRKGPIESEALYPLFRQAPGVLEREPITKTFETGSLTVDSTIPIGKGQRELIIGDRMTGKTTLCVDAIINQKDKGVICIYCCIGRAFASLQKVIEVLKKNGALEYSIIVAAHGATPSSEQYLSPYTACALGEYFMERGRDVFVVFDDLTKHAWAYRQLSLLLERSPGRDAYPGDIFYLHSQLMERAAKYSEEFKSGSMTFFPIVDTLQSDVTGYIPSNLISMTDGQIYFSTALFNSGFKPAIDLGLSVSRIGNKVQSTAVRKLTDMLRLEYLRYNELLKTTRFKANVSGDVAQQLRRGEVITQLFRQDVNSPYPMEKQIILLYALRRKILNELPTVEIDHFKDRILPFAQKEFPDMVREMGETKDLTDEICRVLDECLVLFFKKKETSGAV